MRRRKRNSIILFLLLSVATIPIALGMAIAQADKKAIIKVPTDKEEITEPPEKPSEQMKAEGNETSAKEDEGKADYSYDPTGKVDPFKSFVAIRREIEEEGEEEKPKTYLETLDLSQLALSAIVLTEEGNWALVRDSKGDGHVIRVGTAIGRRGGQVIKIAEKEVVVREYYRDIRRRERIPKDISIKLPEVE